MKKLLGLMIAAALVLSLCSASNARGMEEKGWGMDKGDKGMHENMGKGMHRMGLMKDLGLSKEQNEKITSKEQELEREALPLKQSVDNMRRSIGDELSSDNPDKSKIEKLTDQISDTTKQLQKKSISFILWMREQLTPDQKKKLAERHKEGGIGREMMRPEDK